MSKCQSGFVTLRDNRDIAHKRTRPTSALIMASATREGLREHFGAAVDDEEVMEEC